MTLLPTGARAATDPTSARYLVFSIQSDGTARAVFSKRVRLRTPVQSRPHSVARAASRDRDVVRVTLEDRRRAVVFENTIEIPRWVRGEFHGGGAGAHGGFAIEGHVIADAAPAFVVRVPDVAGATLTLDSPRLSRARAFDLDSVERQSPLARGGAHPPPLPLPGWDNGDPANRLDLLIMGDGYSAAQRTQFDSDAQTLADQFFAIAPYYEYRNYVNARALFTPSSESGVNQPAYHASCDEYRRTQTCCGDPEASAATPTRVATAFGATFCSFNIQRLATVDPTLVYVAASAVPDWDHIFVLINSPTYGGSGSAIGVVSTHAAAVEIAQHEFGHSFMRLADEYATPYPGYPPCSDVRGPFRCEANVTDQTSPALIKWARWLGPESVIPSFDPPATATDAGLWPGARYASTGMYRQGYACLMQFLGMPFCDVAAETYPLRLYGGWWGSPQSGIDNIEPGSENPAPGTVHAAYPGGTYRATVLGPIEGPEVTAEWYVDGGLVATHSIATGSDVTHDLAATPGLHTLELRVIDNSAIIHPSRRASLAASRTWEVTVGAKPCDDETLGPGEPCEESEPVAGGPCGAACPVEPCPPCVMPVHGTKLLLQDKHDQRKRKIRFLSRDTRIDAGAPGGIDPVAHGATLQIHNASGSGESLCLTLPSTYWERSGPADFLYMDPGYTHGPCKVVALRNGRLQAICQAKVKPLAYSLDELTQGAVAVRFSSGAKTLCASFGGKVRADAGMNPSISGARGRFSARDADAPASCPAAPAACP